MEKETKTNFVNRVMGLSFKSIQGKYSFCDDENKKVLFSLDIAGDDGNDVILNPGWNKNNYTHSIKHIRKILDEEYKLFIFKVETKYKDGKTLPLWFDRTLEERKLIVEGEGVYRAIPINYDSIDDDIEERIRNSPELTETEKKQLVKARRGQGRFRQAVAKIEPRCRVTGIADMQHLRASHIKPWRDASNAERLDGHNGLMLTPHIDHLFDQGYISFADNGEILLSATLSHEVAQVFGVLDLQPTGSFNASQKDYLAYHREMVLKNPSVG